MKKRIWVLLGVMLPQSSLAEIYPYCGYYFNANVGFIQPELKNKISFQSLSFFGENLNIQNQSKITDDAVIGSIVFGFASVLFPQNLSSLEVRGYFHDSTPTHDNHIHYQTTSFNADLKTEVKFKGSYSALIKMGTIIEKSLWFLLVGPQWTEITITTEGFFSSSFSKERWGILLGLGIEQMVTEHISLGLEYNFSDYRSFQCQNSSFSSMNIDLSSQAGFIKFSYYYH